MPGNIMNAWPSYLDSYIMPGHFRLLWFKIGRHKLSRFVDIPNPHITKISALPKLFLFSIKQLMFRCIPSTIADIQSPKKSHFLINKYNFLMMAPKKRNNEVIRMPHDLDIIIPNWLEVLLDILWVIIYSYFGFLVNYNIYFYVPFC